MVHPVGPEHAVQVMPVTLNFCFIGFTRLCSKLGIRNEELGVKETPVGAGPRPAHPAGSRSVGANCVRPRAATWGRPYSLNGGKQ